MTGRSAERIVVVVGPTAGGKSELAVAIGKQFDGEIVNADSMQVYRQLDAGTAKPTRPQRDAVLHHLVDIVEPTEPWTVADFYEAAERTITDIRSRGKLPIVVGGTNLYLKALLEGFFEGPPADEAFRASVADVPAQRLHEQLRTVDPEAAERIHCNDHKRIVRALEVFHATGKPISAQQQQWVESGMRNPESGIQYRHNPILIGLRWETEAVNRRINQRVKRMFKPTDGSEDLIAETKRLEDAGLLGAQAREALGTKQVLAHLRGELSADEAFERVKIETRRFAKAQRTWLKRYRGVHWIDADVKHIDAMIEQAVEVVRIELTTEAQRHRDQV